MSTLPIDSSVRAQLSIEIMGLFAFLIMLLLAVIFVSYRDKADILQYTEGVYARNVLENIRMNVNTVAIEGSGFSTEFTIPASLNGADYNVTIIGNDVYLSWSGNWRTTSVITPNITGNLTKGVNLIRNEGGVVVLG